MAFNKKNNVERHNGDGTYVVRKNKKSNIIAFIVCVLIAFVLWMYVMTVEISDNTKTLSVKLDIKGAEELNSDENYSVFGASEALIKVTVQGTKAELHKYSDKDFKAYIDVSKIDEVGIVALNVSVENPSVSLSVLSIDPPSATVYIDEEAEKSVSLEVSLDKNSTGNIKPEFKNDIKTINVLGPKTYIDKIDKALITISATESDLGKEITSLPPVQFIVDSEIMTIPYLSYNLDGVIVVLEPKEITNK